MFPRNRPVTLTTKLGCAPKANFLMLAAWTATVNQLDTLPKLNSKAMMVGRSPFLLGFGNFSGAILNFGRVSMFKGKNFGSLSSPNNIGHQEVGFFWRATPNPKVNHNALVEPWRSCLHLENFGRKHVSKQWLNHHKLIGGFKLHNKSYPIAQ